MSRLTDPAPNSGTVGCSVVTVALLWSMESPSGTSQSKACTTREFFEICLFVCFFVCLSNLDNHRTVLIQSLQLLKLLWITTFWGQTVLLQATARLTLVFKLLLLEMLTLHNLDLHLASRSGSSRTCCLQLWESERSWTVKILLTARHSQAFQMSLRSSVR